MDTDWQPKKLEVEVEVPLTLNLEAMKSKGMQVWKRIGPAQVTSAYPCTQVYVMKGLDVFKNGVLIFLLISFILVFISRMVKYLCPRMMMQ